MFSSTNNLHIFPPPQYFSSSSSSACYHFPPDPNPAEIFIHQPDPLPLRPPQPFLGTRLQLPEEAPMKNEQQNEGGQCYSNFLTKKAAVKKDRHSKIYTAQGLRDRRVRLSIEISRKFFDLQDMLGYDKASKTLDWLLTKSRKAIKELTKTRNNNSSSSGVSKNLYLDSECEVISSETNHEEEKMLSKSSKKINMAFHDMAKESRAKARARARERTKEKIMSKSQAIPEILNPNSSSSSHLHLETQAQAAIQQKENNVIGIMWKPSAIPSSYQKNLVISKGDNFYNNCNNFYFPTNLPPNWDVNTDAAFARAQSGFCSIANMDSFSELQVFGKPWEACNSNQHLH